jgi:four helix bundle protein
MKDMKLRTFQFSVEVGRLIMELPYNVINKSYGGQVVRSSSSVGANYRAARRGKSEADFLYKLKICEEEADETVYFLELLKEFNGKDQEKIDKLIQEGSELVKIIVASILTTKEKMNKK